MCRPLGSLPRNLTDTALIYSAIQTISQYPLCILHFTYPRKFLGYGNAHIMSSLPLLADSRARCRAIIWNMENSNDHMSIFNVMKTYVKKKTTPHDVHKLFEHSLLEGIHIMLRIHTQNCYILLFLEKWRNETLYVLKLPTDSWENVPTQRCLNIEASCCVLSSANRLACTDFQVNDVVMLLSIGWIPRPSWAKRFHASRTAINDSELGITRVTLVTWTNSDGLIPCSFRSRQWVLIRDDWIPATALTSSIAGHRRAWILNCQRTDGHTRNVALQSSVVSSNKQWTIIWFRGRWQEPWRWPFVNNQFARHYCIPASVVKIIPLQNGLNPGCEY